MIRRSIMVNASAKIMLSPTGLFFKSARDWNPVSIAKENTGHVIQGQAAKYQGQDHVGVTPSDWRLVWGCKAAQFAVVKFQ